MLEVMKQYFNISDLQMSKEINNMHDILVELLEKKGISYSVLKSVLIPQKKHHEIILVFDTLQIEDSEYGVACYNAVIKLLDKSESHSFLCGDYISKINTSWKNANDLLYQSLSEHINLSQIEYKSSEQLFFIYITKVSHPLKHQLFSFSFVCLPPYPLTVNTCLTEVMQTIHILRPIFPTLQPLQGFCSSLCRFR